MDSNNKKRFTVAIAIFTLIFAGFAVFSIFNLSSSFDKVEDEEEKADYILALEEKLNITMTGKDDFTDFKQIGYEMVIVPEKLQYYIRPCFDFVIERDGVVITNRQGKAFDTYNLKNGMKITKINDNVLLGKTYFEILELVYALNTDTVKRFTFADGSFIDYHYENDNSNYEYDKNTNTLSLFNLDKLTVKAIYDQISTYENVTLDLSKANFKKYETVVNFLSLFSESDETLLRFPANVIGQKNRKFNTLNITADNTNNSDILFLLTAIHAINEDVKINQLDLKTEEFYAEEIIEIPGYTIYLKDLKLINKASI